MLYTLPLYIHPQPGRGDSRVSRSSPEGHGWQPGTDTPNWGYWLFGCKLLAMGLFSPTCKILAGNWSENSNMMVGDRLVFFKDEVTDQSKMETVELSRIVSVEIATEETIQKMSSTIGLGLLGTALLGPVGLVAGVLASRKKMTTFIFKLSDGRQAIASGEQKPYTAMQTALMKNQMNRRIN